MKKTLGRRPSLQVAILPYADVQTSYFYLRDQAYQHSKNLKRSCVVDNDDFLGLHLVLTKACGELVGGCRLNWTCSNSKKLHFEQRANLPSVLKVMGFNRAEKYGEVSRLFLRQESGVPFRIALKKMIGAALTFFFQEQHCAYVFSISNTLHARLYQRIALSLGHQGFLQSNFVFPAEYDGLSSSLLIVPLEGDGSSRLP